MNNQKVETKEQIINRLLAKATASMDCCGPNPSPLKAGK